MQTSYPMWKPNNFISNISPTVTDPNPVADANPLSKTPTTVEVLLKFEFTLSFDERRLPVLHQTNLLRIGSLRQLAACIRSSTSDQNKDRFQLGK